jgi:protein involved in polysaccharide export with SLBB domain
MRGQWRIVGSVVLGCLIAACGAPFRDHHGGHIDGGLSVQTMATLPAPAPYQIQAGDELTIKFYRNPELDTDLIVRPDGMISMPLVDDIAAAGSTPQALGETLEARYAGELAVPDVTVIVKKFGGQRVWIGGDVETPGEFELTPGLSMAGAIQKAGGFKDSARVSQIVLIRRGADGKPRGTSIDLTDVVGGTHPEQDVVLAPYDIVVVRRSSVGNMNTFVDLYISRNIPASAYWAALLAT